MRAKNKLQIWKLGWVTPGLHNMSSIISTQQGYSTAKTLCQEPFCEIGAI